MCAPTGPEQVAWVYSCVGKGVCMGGWRVGCFYFPAFAQLKYTGQIWIQGFRKGSSVEFRVVKLHISHWFLAFFVILLFEGPRDDKPVYAKYNSVDGEVGSLPFYFCTTNSNLRDIHSYFEIKKTIQHVPTALSTAEGRERGLGKYL